MKVLLRACLTLKQAKSLVWVFCGTNAGELISEASLAIEMGCVMSDIALTVHAHPTLAETTAFAAEMAEGTNYRSNAKKISRKYGYQ